VVNPIEAVGGVIGRIRQELTVARFVGKFAVDGAVARLRAATESPASPAVPVDDRVVADAEPLPPTSAPLAAPPVDELALPDYDLLPAAHVIAALGDLEPDERAAIEAYERAGRHRRTILGKLDQLRDGSVG
jgi:hypothetical protein